MNKLWFVFLTAGLVLNGCQPTADEAPTLTILPSRVPTKTVTSTPATATDWYQSPTPRATPAIEPPIAGAAYRLVTPELDSLVRQYFAYWETWEVTQFLAAHYYPEGRLPYQSVLEYVDQSERITYFSPYFRELLTQALLDYILDNQPELNDILADPSDAFQFSTQQVELDSDPDPELLIRVTITKLYYQGWLTFNPSETGELVPLDAPEPQALFFSLPLPIDLTYLDFDRDGIDDLLFMEEYYWGGGGNSGFINIYRGTSTGYALEYEYDFFYNSKWSDGFWNFKFEEIDPPSVVITNEKSLNWGCDWSYTITVAWENGEFRETHAGENPPNTPECLIAQSTYLWDPFNPPGGIDKLISAISQIHGDATYHPDLETFARFRLALLYAVEGNISAARNQLEAIETLSENPKAEGAQFIAEQLPDIMLESEVKIIQLCLTINDTIQAGDPISNYWKDFLWKFSYPDDYNPRNLCPSFTFMPTFLAALPSPEGSSFEAALEIFGITALALESYTTEEGETLWAGLFDAGALVIAAYQPNLEGDNEWDLLSWLTYLPTDDRQWFSEDLDGDGHKEIALSYSDPYWNKGADKDYLVYLVTFDGAQITWDSDYVSHTILDLRQHVSETYGQDILESIRDKELLSCEVDYNEPNPWFRLDETLRATIGGSCDNRSTMDLIIWWAIERDYNSEARALLEHARGLVDLEDDYGPEAWQNLSYLIALSHELEGHTCEAVAGYLAVWESQPVSPWNALAASHLEAAGPDTNVPACSTE